MFLKNIDEGLNVLKKIKATDKKCIVIIITGSAREGDEKKAMRLGADYYIYKPFSIKVLTNLLAKIIT